MKILYTTLSICLFLSFQAIAQNNNMPSVDSPQYEQMKTNGTLLPNPIPVDNRTEEQKDAEMRAALIELKKTSPNFYIDGKEKRISFGGHNTSGHNTRGHSGGGNPVGNPSGCGSFVPCGTGGGVVSNMPGCDDCSSAALPLLFNFCFYGTNETQVYLNNNGNLSFSAPFFTYVPVPFPTVGYDMIAPFWADVQTNCVNPGTVCYEGTASHFIVTWSNVTSFYCEGTLFNSFQVIITDGSDPILPAGNNIGVNYGQMQWTTGTASGGAGGFGGSSAIVGVNQGNGVGYFQIGGFNAPGTTFFSATAVNNQVGWLTNKTFYFNSCNAALNIPPICSTLNNCDTVRVCGLNDTAIVDALFLSPETGQITNVTVNLNGLTGATVSPIVAGNTCDAQVQIIGSGANAGYHVITFTAWDNGNPVDTTIINATIFIDTSTVGQLNPVITGVLALCGGNSTVLSVSPTNYDSYNWSTGSTNTSITVSTAGYYSVHCVLQSCQATVGVNVVVHPNPTPIILGPTITACGTGTTTLTCDSLIYATYLWSNGATTSSITVGGGNYTLTVTDSNGCTGVSPAVNVVTLPQPVITAYSDTSFCSGTAFLNVAFTGPTNPTVCALSTSGTCSGASNPATIGTGLTSNSAFSYPAPFGNYFTSVTQQYLYTVAELNAAGITAGKIDQIDWNVTALAGITAYPEFTIKMGCTALTTFNNITPVFATGLFTVFPTQTVNVSMGWNTFSFTTGYEWDGISSVIIEVCFSNGPPFPNYTQNCSTPQTVTTNYSSQWSVSDASDQCTAPGFLQVGMLHPDMRLHYCSVSQNPANFTYQWTSFPTGGNIANPTAQNTTGSPTVITDYQITVTNINGGCTATDTVHVGVINISTMHITPAGPFCTASPIDTLQISVPIGTGFFSGSGIIDTNLGIFDPVTAGVGSHVIHYTVAAGPCGVGDTTITIIVANTFDATITNVAPLCTSYNPVTLTAATAGGSWSGYGITDTIAGTFDPTLPGLAGNVNIVTYTIYTPCYSQDTALVSVTQQVDATINPVGGPFCIDAAPIQFSSVGMGGTWGGPGMSTTGLFTPSLAGAGVHTIFHYLTQFCGDTASATVTVIALPVISFVPDITGGCEPTTIHFTSTVDQPGGAYHWNFGDGNTSTAVNPSNTYLSYHGGIPYTVTLTYTNTTGCRDSLTQVGLINIYSQPVAIFNATPQPTDIMTPEIHFHDHSTGVIDSWIWTFGNGAGATDQNPVYTYADTGSYHVVLVVSNIHGCVDTASATIVIDPILTCYIPNAFSPYDENGTNDVFKLSGTDIKTTGFEMSIFDRWGERIFTTGDLQEGWNGRKNNSGEVCELGVYVYKINLKDWKGLGHEYVGHVTLLK